MISYVPSPFVIAGTIGGKQRDQVLTLINIAFQVGLSKTSGFQPWPYIRNTWNIFKNPNT